MCALGGQDSQDIKDLCATLRCADVIVREDGGMTDKEPSEIEARANAASLGPWGGWHVGASTPGGRLGNGGYGRQVQVWVRDAKGPLVTDGICACETGLHGKDEANAVFIAHAREDVPRLVAEVRRLRLLVEEMQKGA